MSLNIAKKLDFLMRLTGTQNNTLGKALSFDASYISRLRLGKRNLPQNRDLIQPLASFFAKNIKLTNGKKIKPAYRRLYQKF